MTRELGDPRYELHVDGLSAPAGEISVDALAEISKQFQKLFRAISRDVADSARTGRPRADVGAASTLRVTGIGEGCTAIGYRRGDPQALDDDALGADEVDRRFSDIVEQAAAGMPGAGTSLRERRAMADFLEAVGRHGDAVSLGRRGSSLARIVVDSTLIAEWRTETQLTSQVTVVGLLERVDLHDNAYRIRDEVGNTIRLTAHLGVDDVRPFIGTEVLVTGTATIADDVLKRVDVQEMRPAGDVVAAVLQTVPEHSQIDPGSISEIAPGGIADLTDEEADAFLTALVP
jgi:hypothetical protein